MQGHHARWDGYNMELDHACLQRDYNPSVLITEALE